jgi:hypothetical protein
MTGVLQGLGIQPGLHGYYSGWGMGLSGSSLGLPSELRTLAFVLIVHSSITETAVI